MIPSKTQKAQVNNESKIENNTKNPHQLERFLTEETVAFLFQLLHPVLEGGDCI